MAERPILVKAVHPYAPANNDELRLEKGEILTVTRKEEGGWWEGTLSNGKTGWFPSNYVEDIGLSLSPTSSTTSPFASLSPELSGPGPALQEQERGGSFCNGVDVGSGSGIDMDIKQSEYRQMALAELVDSETHHVQELKTFWDRFMVPLQKSDILSVGELKILAGNFQDAVSVQEVAILTPLKHEQRKAFKDQRIGHIFLEGATEIEEVHKVYCSNHPKAVQIIERHKEDLSLFLEAKGARKPGILHIITCLSQPFRRLERYSCLLQEIERHVEEFHKDRGDLQRSVEYYKNIQENCSTLRKQKEMELEVLSGAIKDWEGSDVSKFGDIIFMNLVHLVSESEKQPRYFVLFPNTLLILSYNTENNSLVYEGKVPVSGITVRPLGEKDLASAFELTGPMIDPITVVCSGKSVRDVWINHLNSIHKNNRLTSFSSANHQSLGQLTPPTQAWTIDRLRPAPPFNPFVAEYVASCKKQEGTSTSTTSLNSNKSHSQVPIDPSSYASYAPNYSTATAEEDFGILALLDSLCNKNRPTVPTSTSSNEQSVISKPPQLQQTPRTLAQLVMHLRKDVADLKQSLQEEQKGRLALQTLVEKAVKDGTG